MKLKLHDSKSRRGIASVTKFFRVANVTRGTALATSVEIADSSRARRKGLLGRASLSPGQGLWIIPCESVHTWFMHFPIDLIYLSSDNRIEKVRSDVPPWRLSACLSAGSVLELAAGSIRASQTEPGDYVEFSSVSLVGDEIVSPIKS
jgi:uncharacterized protein